MILEEEIRNSKLIEYGDKIVVGVSGGPDSICLLNLLINLREEFNLELFVAHVNHSLRDEADFEEGYVRKFSNERGVKIFSKKVDINKMVSEKKQSTEEVARNVRYEFFNEILTKTGANKIAVAHNLNDSVETVLMNLIRGTGLNGLCGIKNKNGNIIRPLINISRDEIELYIKEKNLITMQDKTNFETVYTRNKVRNELIPYLEQLNPEVVKSVYKTSKLLNFDNEIIKEAVSEKYREVRLYGNDIILDRKKFLELNNGFKYEILRNAISEFSGDLVNISMATIDNAINVIENSQSGSIIKISQNVKIEICYDKLVFFREKEKCEFLYELNIPGDTYIPEIDKKITTKIVKADEVPNKYENRNKCFFDVEKVGEKLYVRNKRDGDFFEPTGMTGKKSLKKFFSDLKIDIEEREKTPIVSTESDIVWIAGFRTSRKFLKDKDTKEVIIFEYGENI